MYTVRPHPLTGLLQFLKCFVSSSKWQADRHGIKCICCHNNRDLVVTAGRSIKLWCSNSYSLLKVSRALSLNSCNLTVVYRDSLAMLRLSVVCCSLETICCYPLPLTTDSSTYGNTYHSTLTTCSHATCVMSCDLYDVGVLSPKVLVLLHHLPVRRRLRHVM